MSKALSKYINIDPEILGGTPVIAGTRIPVERIINLLKQGYNDVDLKKEYPHISIRKIRFLMFYLGQAGLDTFEQSQKS